MAAFPARASCEVVVELLTTLSEMRRAAAAQEAAGLRIGLVPTMGALHEGHLSLLRLLRPRCDRLWATIFVNPAQFGPAEDLSRYPRTLERDLELCRAAGVDGVLAPDPAEVYPPDYATWVVPGPVADRYCGAARPGHFRGVLSIVLRLFQWTRCRAAAFGAKDAQQLWLVRRMVHDLDLGVEIVEGATVREPDGLALSSRNVYLTPSERERALVLSRALRLGVERLRRGDDPARALAAMHGLLATESVVELDYLHVAEWESLDSLAGLPERPEWRGGGALELEPGRELAILVAARVGATRLIDNLRVAWGEPGAAETN
jgi:pantoate--beta-alanine ligase